MELDDIEHLIMCGSVSEITSDDIDGLYLQKCEKELEEKVYIHS